MEGKKTVLACMNSLLAGELAARDQSFIHSRMYAEWGYTKLYERIAHEMEDETGHADQFIRRILMLGGTPNMRPDEFEPGATVVEMLEKDLETEYLVRANLRAGMALCETHQDYVSRDILLLQLRDTEEDHAYWLEKQINLIGQIGLQNYLQTQSSPTAA